MEIVGFIRGKGRHIDEVICRHVSRSVFERLGRSGERTENRLFRGSRRLRGRSGRTSRHVNGNNVESMVSSSGDEKRI